MSNYDDCSLFRKKKWHNYFSDPSLFMLIQNLPSSWENEPDGEIKRTQLHVLLVY